MVSADLRPDAILDYLEELTFPADKAEIMKTARYAGAGSEILEMIKRGLKEDKQYNDGMDIVDDMKEEFTRAGILNSVK